MKYKLNHAGSFEEAKRIEIERMVNGSLIPEIMEQMPQLYQNAQNVISLAREYRFDDACLLIADIERKLGEQ